MARVTDKMCPSSKMANKNGFVMSYEDAYNLVVKTYFGSMQIEENCKITDWQAAKHIYHAPGMNVDPLKYNFMQQKLNKICGESRYEQGSLFVYVKMGPPIIFNWNDQRLRT